MLEGGVSSRQAALIELDQRDDNKTNGPEKTTGGANLTILTCLFRFSYYLDTSRSGAKLQSKCGAKLPILISLSRFSYYFDALVFNICKLSFDIILTLPR